MVLARNPDFSLADALHELERADALFVVREDVPVSNECEVHGLLVTDQSGSLLSTDHVLVLTVGHHVFSFVLKLVRISFNNYKSFKSVI